MQIRTKIPHYVPSRVWQVLAEHVEFEALPFVRVTRQELLTSKREYVSDFYQVQLPDFVVVCPIDDSGHILMLSQYKHGVRRIGLTFPSGLMNAKLRF